MSIKTYVWSLLIPQIVLLLFSPLLRNKPIFRWYYTRVFHPVFVDVNTFRWKFRTIPIFYLSVYIYCTALYFRDVEGLVRPRLYVLERWVIIPTIIAAPICAGFLTLTKRPTTSRNWHSSEPYDNLIFHAGMSCRTCKLPKYARSKHCAICNQCTQLSDHHCIWANNCIGLGNYQFFYGFLVSNVFLTTYGFLRLLTLRGLNRHRSLLVLSILLGCFAVILMVFTYFQLVLVRDGMTTSEESKWLVVHDMLSQGRLVIDQTGRYFYRIEDETQMGHSAGVKNYAFYSTNPYDDKLYRVPFYEVVRGVNEITNIYDKGTFWLNLRSRIHSE
ncbi:LADA_0F02806g1_1 [Lachancea dasiensis]|uniref:Palmitoyltransferase n=1 Tax=Lachancea dasiensis TaxID=1072105 RepID=A0A1G4JIP6_9SACH|nr:LADA_0F02806g1_1 [Lachancea dasiensis]